MFNKEALNEIRETIYNLIEPNVGNNIRTVTAFHNQAVITVNFVGLFPTANLPEHDPSLKGAVLAYIIYMDAPIGKLTIRQAETIDEMKTLFKADFDESWLQIQDTMLDNYIKQLGLANNVCSAFANGKGTVVEAMGGVEFHLEFLKVSIDGGEPEDYFDATVTSNDDIVFRMYDKFDALKTPSISGGIAHRMNVAVKRSFLKA